MTKFAQSDVISVMKRLVHFMNAHRSQVLRGEAGATLALRENKGPTTGVPLSGDEYLPREK
jgi:hypothetical protein